MAALELLTSQPKISIALCTCDGEDYLAEQLISLNEQTYVPYELVVCDDKSEDSTYSLLERFAKSAPFPVRLYRNTRRLGISQNFEQAIRLCSGDVIALCDQDDVWIPDKLARYAELFNQNIDWIFCDTQVTDQALSPLPYTLWERVGFNTDQRQLAYDGRLFEVLLKHHVVAGASLAFRAEFREQLLPIPSQWLYDAWLVAILAATKEAILVEDCLQLYRQHGHNALGGTRRSLFDEVYSSLHVNREDYLKLEVSRWQHLVERLENVRTPAWVQLRLKAKLGHLLRRTAFPETRLFRSPYVLSEIARGGYSRFSRNWGSVALDLCIK